MSAIDRDRLLCRKADTVGAEIEDGYVLLDLDSSKYLQFNATAQVIWEILEAPKPLGGIIDGLQERFDVERETCCAEIEPLLQRFLDLGIVSYQ